MSNLWQSFPDISELREQLQKEALSAFRIKQLIPVSNYRQDIIDKYNAACEYLDSFNARLSREPAGMEPVTWRPVYLSPLRRHFYGVVVFVTELRHQLISAPQASIEIAVRSQQMHNQACLDLDRIFQELQEENDPPTEKTWWKLEYIPDFQLNWVSDTRKQVRSIASGLVNSRMGIVERANPQEVLDYNQICDQLTQTNLMLLQEPFGPEAQRWIKIQ